MPDIGGNDPQKLRQAPRFHAYFSHREGRRVLLMRRQEWELLKGTIQLGTLVEINVAATPIAPLLADSCVEAVVAERQSESEVVIDIYRIDPQDAPYGGRINKDRYRLWERLPLHLNYMDMVNLASTEDNANMRGFLEDHVFLVKDEPVEGHWLPELPARVRAALQRDRQGSESLPDTVDPRGPKGKK